jgi:hypothetical protein
MTQPDQLTPSLAIFQEVLNIGEPQVTDLRQKLTKGEDGSLARPKVINKLLEPTQSLRSWIALPSEVRQLLHYAGIEDIDEEQIDELKEYVEEILPTAAQKQITDVPTLPTQLDPLGKGLVLSVAGNPEAMQARALVKAGLANFYRLISVPEEVWYDDEYVACTRLAYSLGPSTNGFLRRLNNVELNCDDTLLPARTELGGITVNPDPSRDQ